MHNWDKRGRRFESSHVRLYGILRSITDALLKHASKEDDELFVHLAG